MVNQYNPTYDPAICEKVPSLFSNGRSITGVAVELGIARSTLYEWIDRYPEFKQAIEAGLNKSEAYMEKLALEGVTGEIEKFSAPMLIFMMKNRFKQTYGEQKEEKSVGDSLLEQIVLGKVKVVNNEP